ncbi:MAG TPA: anti-sigma-D factor RsdA, partial [Mycobacterium sp.]|nr:anti-sigma-D factor RsdA [Mycobacterium sp.]
MPDFSRWTSSGGDPSLNEINRTDRFIDALASKQPVYSTDPAEAELAYLMAGWRDNIRDTPARAVITERDAAAALDRATTSRKRGRLSMAVVGSVAAAMLCLGGFGAVVAGAGPGDALYGLRTMLFGAPQVARDDQVVLAAQTQLAEAQQLIKQGQWQAAQDKLQAVTTTVATVDDDQRKQDLVSQWQQLTVKVESRDPNATVPPNVPPPSFPDVPAVVAPGETSTSTVTSTTLPATTSSTSPSETTTGPSETTSSSQPGTSTPSNLPAEAPPPSSPNATTPTTSPVTSTATSPPPSSTTSSSRPSATVSSTSQAPAAAATTTTTIASAPREQSSGTGSTAVQAPATSEVTAAP